MRDHCVWAGNRYATWRLLQVVVMDGLAGNWSSDCDTLLKDRDDHRQPGRVCVTGRLRAG